MSEVLDTPMQAAPAVKPAAKRDLILSPARMSLAEQWRQDWVANAEAGTTVDDVMDPQYWSHMAAQMQPYDHVEVRLETGEWVLELLVVSVGRNFAQVMLKHRYDLVEASKSETPGSKHEVINLGPQRKWAVKRVSDSAVLQEGLAKRNDAQAWMDNYENITAKV